LGARFAVFATSSGLFGFVRKIFTVVIALIALASSLQSASAQGIFEALFGRPWSSAPSAYADPSSQLNPFGGRTAPSSEATGTAYCVRLCDGRYFPIQRHAGLSPAQACSSFCPASATKIYSGSTIEHATAPDGKRYSELGTAFTYRDKLVPGCTCNGKDAFGLVTTPVADDPTLRPGDIVATNTGLMAYDGGPGRQASFTPIESYNGLSSDLRRQLTETKIAPATERGPPPPPSKQADASQRTGKNKRVQLDR
jgi:hypothetical protein